MQVKMGNQNARIFNLMGSCRWCSVPDLVLVEMTHLVYKENVQEHRLRL